MAAAEVGEEAADPTDDCKDLLHLNVGAWIFPIPQNKLAPFPESSLYREARLLPKSDRRKIFLDGDGFVFAHIHHFLLTSQLPISSLPESQLLYEQARRLNLLPVVEALDKLKAGKENPHHEETVTDIPASDQTTIKCWKTHKCSNRLSGWPLKMSSSPGIQDRAPLGLLRNPLLDVEEEVHYCFFPIDILKKYPALATDDNVLWFSEKFILIEYGCPEFRFIGNFFHYGKFFLPDNFSASDVLEAEIYSLEIPGLLKAFYNEKQAADVGTWLNPCWRIWLFYSVPTEDNKHHIPVCFKPSNTLRQQLVHPKDPTSKHKMSNVVYAVQCNEECPDLYIGEMKEQLHQRMAKHRRAKTSGQESAVYLHLKKKGHSFEDSQVRILDREEDWLKRGSNGSLCVDMPEPWHPRNSLTASKTEQPSGAKPFYIMSLELLGKYPDSALGQLYIESSVDDSKLYICGTGSLFQHVKNWLGACRLPLTSSASEIQHLCIYLDKGDIIYEPMKEAMTVHLNHRLKMSPGAPHESWRADVQPYFTSQIVRVYVGSHWYATHLKTLLKYPDLLANSNKTCWMVYGFSLLVIGDGSIFRHILNFLRLGRLLLPSDFKEWRLLCHEVNEFKISALQEALCQSLEYRLWLREQESTDCALDFKHEDMRWNAVRQQMIPLDRSQGHKEDEEDANCFTSSSEVLKRVDSNRNEASSTSQFTTLQCDSPGGLLRAKLLKLDRIVIDEVAKVTASPMSKLMPLVKKLSDSGAKDPVCDELQGRGHLNTFPTLSRRGEVRSPRCAADEELKQNKLIHISVHYPVRQIMRSKSSVQNGGGKENAWPCHSSKSLRFNPVQKDKMNLLRISHKDKIKWDARQEDDLVSYTKMSSSLSKCTGGKMEEDRMTCIEHAYCARSPRTEGKKFADLGAVLWVHHHHLMGNDGSTGSFQDCIVFTTEQEIKMLTPHGAASNDLLFLSVNMSYEEVFYARKCHSFLTGIIMDSLEQRDPNSTTGCVAGLVSMLWASQIPDAQFVDDLFALEMFKDEGSTKETLLCWLKLTLPYAKKLSQCINVMLQKRCHNSSSCCILRKVLS